MWIFLFLSQALTFWDTSGTDSKLGHGELRHWTAQSSTTSVAAAFVVYTCNQWPNSLCVSRECTWAGRGPRTSWGEPCAGICPFSLAGEIATAQLQQWNEKRGLQGSMTTWKNTKHPWGSGQKSHLKSEQEDFKINTKLPLIKARKEAVSLLQ